MTKEDVITTHIKPFGSRYSILEVKINHQLYFILVSQRAKDLAAVAAMLKDIDHLNVAIQTFSTVSANTFPSLDSQ